MRGLSRAVAHPGATWGRSAHLTVKFMDNPSAPLKTKILGYMNAWRADSDVHLSFVESAEGQIRISRVDGEGNWAEIGNHAAAVPAHEATMNLDNITDAALESQIRRIVMHETGHCIGLLHEHLRQELVDRIVPHLAIDYFADLNGWDETRTRTEVLSALTDPSLLTGGAPDPDSVMCYFIPGSITTDGVPILGGGKPSAGDIAFVKRLYPGAP